MSSIALLDAVERARLDEWGNRAVLARPAPAAMSIPRRGPRKWRAPPMR
ncbi:putative PEPTIDE SYNTHETASE NRP domain protein [Mycobacterium kansasii 824]|nr:putative PEPTIDE SYNTHETASE NRP domain protein [Mycobacterium kansasii 824]